MSNLLARRTGAQDRIIPEAFRDRFRSMGFVVGTAPEGLPIVDEPTMLSELKRAAQALENEPERSADPLACVDCGKVCKTPKGLRQHRTRKHPIV